MPDGKRKFTFTFTEPNDVIEQGAVESLKRRQGNLLSKPITAPNLIDTDFQTPYNFNQLLEPKVNELKDSSFTPPSTPPVTPPSKTPEDVVMNLLGMPSPFDRIRNEANQQNLLQYMKPGNGKQLSNTFVDNIINRRPFRPTDTITTSESTKQPLGETKTFKPNYDVNVPMSDLEADITVLKQEQEKGAKIYEGKVSQLKSLEKTLLARKNKLNPNSKTDVDSFNQSVDEYNQLLGEVNSLGENLKKGYETKFSELKKKYPVFQLPEDVSGYMFDKGLSFQTKETELNPYTGKPLSKLDDKDRANAYQLLTRSMMSGKPIDQVSKEDDLRGTQLGRILGSFGQGVLSTGSGIAGFQEYLGDKLGIEGYKNLNKALKENVNGWIKEITPNNPNFMEQFASGLGSYSVFLPMGLGSMKLTEALFKVSPKLANWFGAGAMTTLEAMMEAGSVYDESGDSKAAERTFLNNMLIIGLTNKYGIFNENIKNQIAKALASASMEGLQEGAQEVISNGSQGKKIDWSNVLASTGIGAILGAGGAIVMEGAVNKEELKRDINKSLQKDQQLLRNKQNAIQERSTDEVLQRQQGQVGERGRGRGQVEQGSEGKETPQETIQTPEVKVSEQQQVGKQDAGNVKRDNELQLRLMTEAGIPEAEMPDYALSSVADGKLLRDYINEIKEGKLTEEEAAERVKNDYARMKSGEKEGKFIEPTEQPTGTQEEEISTEETGGKVEKLKKFYRGGGEGSMPRGLTAKDVVDYETKELGNDIKIEPDIKLDEIPSEKLVWLTEKQEDALEYGDITEVDVGENYRIVARDKDGGVLIEKNYVGSEPESLKEDRVSPESIPPTIKPPQSTQVGKGLGSNVTQKDLARAEELNFIKAKDLINKGYTKEQLYKSFAKEWVDKNFPDLQKPSGQGELAPQVKTEPTGRADLISQLEPKRKELERDLGPLEDLSKTELKNLVKQQGEIDQIKSPNLLKADKELSKVKDFSKVKVDATTAINEIAPRYKEDPKVLTKLFEVGNIINKNGKITDSETTNIDPDALLKEEEYLTSYKKGNDWYYDLNERGQEIYDKIKERIATRERVKKGEDLFPEDAGIPQKEYLNQPQFEEQLSDKETSDIKTIEKEARTITKKEKTSPKRKSETIEKIDTIVNDINEKLTLLGYYTAEGETEKDITEYGSKMPEKKFKKDLTKFANELKKGLGYEDHLDKKGRKNTVNTNIAPIGGDGTIILWKPNTDYGVYISVGTQRTEGDNLKIEGLGWGADRFMWRVTTKKDVYGGLSNQWVKNNITAGEFVRLIKEAVDRAETQGTKKADLRIGTVEEQKQQIKDLASKKKNVSTEKPTTEKTNDRYIKLFKDKAEELNIKIADVIEVFLAPFKGMTPVSNEELVSGFIGGISGSGKSTFIDDYNWGNRVRVDSDISKNKVSPENPRRAHELGSAIAKQQLEKAKLENYNFTSDSLFKNYPLIKRSIEGTLSRGGKVNIDFIDITPETSRIRTAARYLKALVEGRPALYVPKDTIIEGTNSSLPTFLAIFEEYKGNPRVNFRLYDGNGDNPAPIFERKNGKLEIFDKEKFGKLKEVDYIKTEEENETRFQLSDRLQEISTPDGEGEIIARIVLKASDGDYVFNQVEVRTILELAEQEAQGRIGRAGQEKLEALKEQFKKPRTKPTLKQKIKSIEDEELKNAFDDFISGTSITSGIDPVQLAKGVKLMSIYAKLGIYKFADIIADAYTRIGKDALKKAFDSIKAAYGAYYFTAPKEIAEQMDASAKDFTFEELIPKLKPGETNDQGKIQTKREGNAGRIQTSDVQEAPTEEGIGGIPGGESGSNVPGIPTSVEGNETYRSGRRIRGDGSSNAPPPEGIANRPGYTGLEQQAGRSREQRGNYRITDADKVGIGSFNHNRNYKNNVEAIKLVKQLIAEKRKPTLEEKSALVKYVGWGGMSKSFQIKGGRWVGNRWVASNEELDQLQELLDTEEFKAAKASTINAHYTSPEIIKGMWDILNYLGFKGGKILEPGMGIGHFYGFMPDNIEAMSKLYGVELDDISTKIASMLYEDAKINDGELVGKGYQDIPLLQNSFDLIISNVPFADINIFDATEPRAEWSKRKLSLHNFYFAKSLDKVKPGGMVAFITTHYTLDSKSRAFREYLAEKADLIAAIRLPNNAFKGNANTEVVTDIIFLRKKDKPGLEEVSGSIPKKQWLDVVNKDIDGTEQIYNKLFDEHPEFLLGEHSSKGSMYKDKEYTVLPKKDVTLEEQLKGLLREDDDRVLPKDLLTIMGNRQIMFPEESEAPSAKGIKKGGLTVVDGKVYRRKDNELIEEKELSKETKRIQALKELTNKIDIAIDAQKNLANDQDVQPAMNALNKSYDDFVKKYGQVNNKVNKKIFYSDPDYPKAQALENIDKDGNIVKADIFSRRVYFPERKITKSDTPKDALLASLTQKNGVDIDYMSQLLGRSADELIGELKGIIYKNPNGGYEVADEYLSGDVKTKLEWAERAAKDDPKYNENVEALKAVIPKDVEPIDIGAEIGSTWIPPKYYAEFINDLLGIEDISVGFIKKLSQYVVNAEPWRLRNNLKNTEEFGIDRFNAIDIFKSTLNFGNIAVYDVSTDAFGEEIRTINQEKTIAAKEKQEKILNEFQKWLWSDSKRADEIKAIYNNVLNRNVPRNFDGSHLTFPGLTKVYKGDELKTYPHQKNSVWRILQKANVLLGQVVGSGKTNIMIIAGMEMKRLGLRNKVMYAVTPSTLPQIAEKFRMLYPFAKILVAEKADLKKENRAKFMSKIATNDWDAVIVAHSSYSLLPISDKVFNDFMQQQLDELEEAIQEAKAAERAAGGGRRSEGASIVKELEKAKKRLEEKIKKRAARESKDVTINFDDLGVDFLFVDEADLFKNLYTPTKLTRLPGINTTMSGRAFDMYMKINWLYRNFDSGVTFATGTPVSNALSELFIMQRYLQPETLREHGIYNLDSWVHDFGNIVTQLELTPEGNGYREKKRLNGLKNLPELMRIYSDVADLVRYDDIKDTVKRPSIKGGKSEVVSMEPSDVYLNYLTSLANRAKAVRENKVDKKVDNMLKVTNDGRKASLDMRLIDKAYPDLPNSKVNTAVQLIHDIWVDTKSFKGTQLVFCDLGTPKVGSKLDILRTALEDDVHVSEELVKAFRKITTLDKAKAFLKEFVSPVTYDELMQIMENPQASFNIYNDVKKKLVAKGIPAAQVKFIHDAKNEKQLKELFDDVNSGKVRVIIGSTSKMGAGINVQRRAVAEHHLDAPWRPRDIEQREGRILRQGNKVEEFTGKNEVRILRYVTKGLGQSTGFDAYLWQILENKARAIAMTQTIDPGVRTIEEIEGRALSYAEVKALASGNPYILEKVQVDNELIKLERLLSEYEYNQFNYKRIIAGHPGHVETATERIKAFEKLVELSPKEEYEITIEGEKFEIPKVSKEAGDKINEIALAMVPSEEKNMTKRIGEVGGFNIDLVKEGNNYYTDSYESPYYNKEQKAEVEFVLIPKNLKDFSIPVYSTNLFTFMNNRRRLLRETGGWTIHNINQEIESYKNELNKEKKYLADNEKKLVEYKRLLDKPFEYSDRLHELRKRRDELERLLRVVEGESEAAEGNTGKDLKQLGEGDEGGAGDVDTIEPPGEERFIPDKLFNQAKNDLGLSNINFNSIAAGSVEGVKVLKNLSIIGAYHLENLFKGKTQEDLYKPWLLKMTKDVGKGIRQFAKKVWEEAKLYLSGEKAILSPNTLVSIGGGEFRGRFSPRQIEEARNTGEEIEEQPIEIPDETLFQAAQRKLQDSMNRSKQVVDLGRAEIIEQEDFRLQAELYIGRASDKIDLLNQRITNDKDGFIKRLSEAGFSIDDLGEYLYAKHAKERNEYILNEYEKENGSGITDEEADNILRDYAGTDIERFAREFRETVIKPNLDLMKSSGFLTEDAYDELQNQYEFYVPLKGTSKDVSKYRVTGKGFSVKHKGIIAARGRQSIPDNPFVQALLDYEDTIIRAEKNKVGQSLLDFIKKFPDIVKSDGKKLWEVRSQRFVPSYDKFGEINRLNKRYKVEDNELSVWVDGKQKIITIHDEALVRGLKNMGAEKGIKFLSEVNNYLRAVITMASPEFMITNFQRDIQTALVNIQAEEVKGVTRGILKDVPKAINGIWKEERDKPGNEWTRWFNAFKAEGGKTGWLENDTIESKTEKFRKRIKDYQKRGKIKAVMSETVKFIEDMNMAVENGTRVAVYKNLVTKGISKQKAASIAKNITLNFNKKGEWGSIMNSLWLFSNAGVQGTARIFTALKHKNVRKAVLGIAALSFVLNWLNRMIDDDEYEKLSKYQRDANWIFMLPNKKHFKIKLPYGFNFFAVIGNATGDMAFGDMKVGDGIGRLFSSAVDAFNPFGTYGSFNQLFAPTILDPFVQIAENKSFSGEPLTKEQPQYSPKVANSQLYFRSVNPYTKDMTKWLNELTGSKEKSPLTEDELAHYNKLLELQEAGEINPMQAKRLAVLDKRFKDVTSGWLDINPDYVDHMIDFLGGGTGRFITNSIFTGEKLITGGDIPLNKIPVARQILGESSKYGDQQLVYSMFDESKRTEFTEAEREKFYKALKNMLKEGFVDGKDYQKMLTTFNKGQGLIK